MQTERFIPKGAASFHLAHDGPPRDCYFLLLPKLTMLAFSAAVEPLRIANQVTRKELYRWFTLSGDGGPIRCSNGVQIQPDSGLETMSRDALVFVCSGVEPAEAASGPVLNWLRRQRAFGVQLGGICTGAFALAEIGALQGRAFTLHWENQPAFAERYPGLEPSGALYEVADGMMTCGGGSAATDMMLELIEREHGAELAIVVADMCIHTRSHNRAAPQQSAYSVAIGSRNPRLLAAMQYMQDNLEEPLTIHDIAAAMHISRRQLERLFKRYVGVSPNAFLVDLRLKRAHALLNETNLSVTEIAAACGFGSTRQMSERFREAYGRSPHHFRKGWQGA